MSTVTGSSTAAPAYTTPFAASPATPATASAAASLSPTTATAVKTSTDPGSSTVTLSAQAMNALNRDGKPAATNVAPTNAGPSTYEMMKHGIASAVDGVEDAAAEGWHLLASGVEKTVSAVDTLAHGIVDLPFVAVSTACDAAAAVLDAL